MDHKMEDPSQSALYLSTSTLSQNELGILLTCGGRRQSGTGKKNKIWKKTCTKRGFCKVINDFSFFEHPWPSEMKFLPCSKHI